MRSRVYVTVGRPSVCLSHRSTAAGGFVAERSAGRRYRSVTAGTLRAPCCSRRRSAANAGSVNTTLRADGGGSLKGVRRILVKGVNAPLPPEAKKLLKI